MKYRFAVSLWILYVLHVCIGMFLWSVLLQGDKFREAEEIFKALLDEKVSPLKPDQKMFHMMIYMHKKEGAYDKARKLFGLMREREVQQTTVTYNSLMSFETNYKEVANIFDQVHSKPEIILLASYGTQSVDFSYTASLFGL